MKKVIILSVRPEHAYNIITGKKTLELRKRVPKGYKGWVYVYVTKAIKDYRKGFYYQPKNKEDIFHLHGNIPCRFWFDEYIKLKYGRWVNHEVGDWNYRGYMDEHLKTFDKLCLSETQVNDYGKGKDLYAWHIKDLEIFDKPMELGELYKEDDTSDEIIGMTKDFRSMYIFGKPVTKAPQSYMYAWVKEELK